MDTGGLAQMTYNNNHNFPANNNGLGVPGSGFASRGKGGHIKRLSVAPPSSINSIYEDEVDINPPPRTSRSHMLAGLRTAPRTTNGVPASAPYYQTQHRSGHDASAYGNGGHTRLGRDMPQTAATSYFSGMNHQQAYDPRTFQQVYSSPEQVLAPPELGIGNGLESQMDPDMYNELMMQNLYLLQRQQQLQQQLMNVTAAAQQFQGLNLNNGSHLPQTPMTPQTSIYSQQAQSGLQPVINPVPNQPGVYTVYNPMTGQQSVYYDQAAAQSQQATTSPVVTSPIYSNSSPDSENASYFRRDNMSPPTAFGTNNKLRTITPPKSTPSPPQDVKPLPAPSSNAFRPGHRKSLSNAFVNSSKNGSVDSIKSAVPRSAGFQATPTTGTFGLGMGRAGEHPSRQPRGPPPLEELVAAPTSKHEGSKNFATRQRRRAVHNLVRAGNERRSGRSGSADGATPTSEAELHLGHSDADSEGSPSAVSSSGQSSLSAIGSERTELKERNRGSPLSSGGYTPGKIDFAGAVKAEDPSAAFRRESEKRKTPLLVLTSAAEKRKTSGF